MRKNEIHGHLATDHTTEFPSGQRGWTQDPLLRLRRFESCLRHHTLPSCIAGFHTVIKKPLKGSQVRTSQSEAVLEGKCGEQDSNLRTVEDCDLNAAPLTKLGDPRVQNRRCAGLLSSHPSAYSEAKMASTKGGNVAP